MNTFYLKCLKKKKIIQIINNVIYIKKINWSKNFFTFLKKKIKKKKKPKFNDFITMYNFVEESRYDDQEWIF